MTELNFDIFELMQRLEKFEKRIDKVEATDVNERLGYIEKHLRHFVYAAKTMSEKFENGIKVGIDETALHIAANVNRHLQESAGVLKSEVLAIRQCREDMLEELKDNSVIGSLQYIAKQLTELTQTVSKIEKEGVKKKLHLGLTLDGYEMVKRKSKKIEDIEANSHSETVDQEEDVKKLLETLTKRESEVLIHRYGLFGENKKTLNKVGLLMNVTRERIRQLEAKTIRKLRHPTRKELVDNIRHLDLYDDIKGGNK